MQGNRPLLGLCPIGKFVFSNEDAIRQKQALQAKLRTWDIPYVDLDGVLEDGLVKDQTHVDRVVEHFRAKKVDCVFMPHCNFGTEGAVGMIGKQLGLPVLLWGPRDEAPEPDGRRLRDTLCGLFASSKVLYKLGVLYMYIENCRTDDVALQKGVDTFLRAVSVADVFRRGARVGLVGSRIDFFWTTIVNESELLQRFNIEVRPFDMVEFIEASQDRARRGRAIYEREMKGLRDEWIVEDMPDEAFVNVLAVRDQMLALAADHGLEGIAFQTFNSVINAMGAYCVLAESQVAEKLGYALESDIHGAISSLLVRRANYNCDAVYPAEFTTRHPTNDNAVLVWHAGGPISMRHPDEPVRMGHHWILPSPLSGMLHFRLKDGPVTVARFDGELGDYRLAVGEGRTVEGPATLNNYLWMQVDDWPRWERTLIEGPYIHHCAMGYGHHADALLQACKFVPGLKPVELGRAGD